MVNFAIIAVLIVLFVFVGLYFFRTDQNLPTTGFPKQTETTTSIITSITSTTTEVANFLRRDYYLNISSGSGVRWFSNGTIKDIRSAFDAWQLSTNNLIQFNEVNDTQADIVIGFVGELNMTSSTITIGETYVHLGLIKGSIQLVPQALSCRNRGIMIHEIGHIIGLEHNKTERSDIMYPLQNLACGQNISSYDVGEARRLVEELIS